MIEWCIPWWHGQLAKWQQDKRPVTECEALTSATAQFPLAQFVTCPPEQLRAAAEKSMQVMGVWRTGTKLAMDVYSVARNIASECGDGTPEEMVVTAECVLNESQLRKISPTQLLLTNKLKLPFYGGVEGHERWASTTTDPTVGHLLIALFVMSGKTEGFARGGTRYVHPDDVKDDPRLFMWLGQQFASGKWGWTGHYPGVNIRKLFVMRPLKETSVEQINENQKGLADLRGSINPPPPTEICPLPGQRKRDWKKLGPIAAVAGIGALLAAGVGYAVAETNVRRWKEWDPPETETPDAPEPPEPPTTQSLPGAS
jgi:hypothetical protein